MVIPVLDLLIRRVCTVVPVDLLMSNAIVNIPDAELNLMMSKWKRSQLGAEPRLLY